MRLREIVTTLAQAPSSTLLTLMVLPVLDERLGTEAT
jgi:hypothetical protein